MIRSMRVTAAVELALIAPAALFLTAVLVGAGDPPQHDLALVAHRIVAWYAGRGWTLWLLLVAMPVTAVAGGAAALFRASPDPDAADYPQLTLASVFEPIATLLVGWATLTAAAILIVVALHVAAN
jgi:hypothetical protein